MMATEEEEKEEHALRTNNKTESDGQVPSKQKKSYVHTYHAMVTATTHYHTDS